ncbi:type IV secretion system protein [Phenylobacterium deserti]|uniref:Type IV secretion system protein VirB6 n=1 Tax=Phenylobacterium deserti TaxID=1914756 RepID=A0A328ADD0_9CAUL|nr:type IV secretion system protein [Phenylobacterium deserti]RAK52772.1 type IV secretion system protein VirB6 [Phenylobacterium deserti]
MNGGFQVFGPAYAAVDARLAAALGDGAARAIAEVAGPLRLALALYVLLYGFAILRGAIAEPLADFAVRSVKLAALYALAATPAYGDWIVQPLFHAAPDLLARAVGGAAAAEDAGQVFDAFLARAGLLGQACADQASAFDWLPLLVAGAVFAAGTAAAAVGFGVLLLAKVALALLIALGPLFVGLALFDATRRWFVGWLSQAVNYLVLFALLLAVLALVEALVADQWSALQGQDPVAAGLLFVALALLAGVLFLQVPAIAAGIAGGASAGLADFANAAALGLGARPRTPSPAGGGRTRIAREGGSVRPLRGRA